MMCCVINSVSVYLLTLNSKIFKLPLKCLTENMNFRMKYFGSKLKHLNAIYGHTSVFARYVIFCACVGYTLSFFEWPVNMFTFQPGFVLRHLSAFLWLPQTFWFMEMHWPELLLNILLLGWLSRYLEITWNENKMLVFFCFINACVAAQSLLAIWIYASYTGDANILFGGKIQGLSGFLSALALAACHMQSQRLLIERRVPKFRYRYLALLLPSVAVLSWQLQLLSSTKPIMCATGCSAAWFYLKMCKCISENGHSVKTTFNRVRNVFTTKRQPITVTQTIEIDVQKRNAKIPEELTKLQLHIIRAIAIHLNAIHQSNRPVGEEEPLNHQTHHVGIDIFEV